MYGEKMFQVTIRRESRWKTNARFMFMLIGMVTGAAISHVIAVSWIIECTFVLLVFLSTWMFFDQQKVLDEGKIFMTAVELRAYLDAGCPLEWPPSEAASKRLQP